MNTLTNNGSDQIHSNDSSKQRIIIALAVLCAALAVLLGFLVSIIVCQWWQHDKDEGEFDNEINKTRSDNYHDPAYRQAIKL